MIFNTKFYDFQYKIPMIFNIILLLEMKWGKIVYLWEVAHGGMIRDNSLTSERFPPTVCQCSIN